MDRELPEGTPVRLTLKEQIVFGRICYCLPAAEREFLLGVHLDQTLDGLEDLTRLNQALQANRVDGVVERAKETLTEGLGERG